MHEKEQWINAIRDNSSKTIASIILADIERIEKQEKQEKEIKKLNKQLENLEKLNNANYQSFIEVNNIINKAIDFLKENACIDEDVEYFCDDLRYDDCKKLLNILKGEDK